MIFYCILEICKECNFKCSQYINIQTVTIEVMYMLINLIVVIISQSINILKNHILLFKHAQFLFVNNEKSWIF